MWKLRLQLLYTRKVWILSAAVYARAILGRSSSCLHIEGKFRFMGTSAFVGCGFRIVCNAVATTVQLLNLNNARQ